MVNSITVFIPRLNITFSRMLINNTTNKDYNTVYILANTITKSLIDGFKLQANAIKYVKVLSINLLCGMQF